MPVPDHVREFSLDAGSSRELEASRLRQLPAWHAMFVLVWSVGLGLTIPAIVADGTIAPAGALFGALATAYGVLGVPALTAPTPPASVRSGRRYRFALGYLVIGWAAALTLAALVPGGGAWVLLLALYPQTWTLLPVAESVAATVVAALTAGWLTYLAHDAGPGRLADAAALAGLMVATSVGLGLFIQRVFGEARRRAMLLDELRAAQAGRALAERREGRYAERERLSREIHDSLAQGFISIAALASASRSALARGDQHSATDRLELIEHTARDNLSEARLMLAEMAPAPLHERTLVEALERLVATVNRESGLRGELVTGGDPERLATGVEVLLMRTAQEALANVRRHAMARGYRVCLDYEPRRVRLRVTDDGVGFDPAPPYAGFGLHGAAGRAAEFDGSLSLTSAPGAGTTVELCIPRSTA